MPTVAELLAETWPAKLAQGIWGGVTAPRDAYQGKLDPLSDEGIGRATDLAGVVMGGAYGAPRGALGSGPVKPIRAFHGSPYDFERFDMSKIGTGEGAQAYGHGLYFAEKEGVARGYRDRLSTGSGQMMEGASVRLDPDVGYIAIKPTGEQKVFSFEKEAKDWVEHPGRMYEVNINARPEQFLDWDKPLAQQSSEVLRGLGQTEFPYHAERLLGSRAQQMTGGKFIQDVVGDHPLSSDLLREEAGIPGIKYLDQGSRLAPSNISLFERHLADAKAAGDPAAIAAAEARLAEESAKNTGTSNYVLFRDDIIDIVKKYGWAGLAAMGFQPSKPTVAESLSQ